MGNSCHLLKDSKITGGHKLTQFQGTARKVGKSARKKTKGRCGQRGKDANAGQESRECRYPDVEGKTGGRGKRRQEQLSTVFHAKEIEPRRLGSCGEIGVKKTKGLVTESEKGKALHGRYCRKSKPCSMSDRTH